jgi:dTMP kinase
MGLFITFEGIEGCGKTTQITLGGDFLHKKNLSCLITREPGGTPIGDEIRKILLDTRYREIVPLTELLLYTASKVQHLHQVIQPALVTGSIILCDRFFDATVAYQGYGEGLDLMLLREVQTSCLQQFSPDVTLLLDCPVELGLRRSRQRIKQEGKEQAEGRFEEKELAFHERVRQGYLELARAEPQRFHIVDARQEAGAVHQAICSILTNTLKEKGYAI